MIPPDLRETPVPRDPESDPWFHVPLTVSVILALAFAFGGILP